MKLLIILLGLTLTFDCYGQRTSDEKEISKAVTSFYVWYIGTTKNRKYSQYVKGVKDEQGKTKLETTEYFKRLDSLGVIGQEFIDSEKKRMQPCSDFLKTVPWTEFSTADDFPYEDQCDFLYYYYWTYGQEPHDNVEVLKVTIEKQKATAETNIYFGDTKSNGDKVIVRLTKQKGKWWITKIEQ
ncbi:MAG: hypothetical protein IM631_18200 [Cytophagales bacterium]|nr:hypothetical protein [Cytophagales bacterium]MCA6373302.1 hypothetical protein [Cytophagales bacterium]MCA6377895.1 hypothetical protein [Cytophagales bacterium]MCA6386174.1 hypothetical protein [Cytophagales bacterium]